MLQAHQRNSRVVVPALKSVEVLFARGGVASAGALGAASDLPDRLLVAIRAEITSCRDIPRLQVAASVLCHLSTLDGGVRNESLRSVVTLLANRFPTVRRWVAEQLYMRLLTFEDEEDSGGCDPEQLEEALCVVADTKWDGLNVDQAKAERNRIYPCLGLEPPKVKAKAAAKGGGAEGKGSAVQDENLSYRSLVDAAGY